MWKDEDEDRHGQDGSPLPVLLIRILLPVSACKVRWRLRPAGRLSPRPQ
jgi:hypothetical protein